MNLNSGLHILSYSAFFARPISIATVYSHTNFQTPNSLTISLTPDNIPTMIPSVSSTTPIVQTRQVYLQCAGKIVCTATSTVRITSPRCAHLFLEEKYAIGQMFRKLEKLPQFELVSVGFGAAPCKGTSPVENSEAEKEQLWRRYKLIVPEFECEILEIFPSREMFTRSEEWLAGTLEVQKSTNWTSFQAPSRGGYIKSESVYPTERSQALHTHTITA